MSEEYLYPGSGFVRAHSFICNLYVNGAREEGKAEHFHQFYLARIDRDCKVTVEAIENNKKLTQPEKDYAVYRCRSVTAEFVTQIDQAFNKDRSNAFNL